MAPPAICKLKNLPPYDLLFVSSSARVTSVKSQQGVERTSGPIDGTPGKPGSDEKGVDTNIVEDVAMVCCRRLLHCIVPNHLRPGKDRSVANISNQSSHFSDPKLHLFQSLLRASLNNVQLKIEDEKMVRRPNLEEVAIFKLGQGPMNFSFNIINNKNSKYMFTYSQQFTPKFNFYS